MTNNTDGAALFPVTPELDLAQFFFEMGFGACYAEAIIQNGNKVPFPLTDAEIERQWAISREAYDDADELEAMLSLALSKSHPLHATQEDAERAGVGLGNLERWSDISDDPDAIVACGNRWKAVAVKIGCELHGFNDGYTASFLTPDGHVIEIGPKFRKALSTPAMSDLQRQEYDGEAVREALERIADPRNTHFAGDAQVVARDALAALAHPAQARDEMREEGK